MSLATLRVLSHSLLTHTLPRGSVRSAGGFCFETGYVVLAGLELKLCRPSWSRHHMDLPASASSAGIEKPYAASPG